MSQQPPTAPRRAAERGPQSVIGAGVSALVRRRWGRGPSSVRAFWAGPDTLLLLLDDAHTEAEQTLLEDGRGADVLAGRRLLGEIAEPELREIAASATGRRVLGVLWQSSLDPPLSAIVIAYVPEPRAGRDEERLGDALRQALGRSSAAPGPHESGPPPGSRPSPGSAPERGDG